MKFIESRESSILSLFRKSSRTNVCAIRMNQALQQYMYLFWALFGILVDSAVTRNLPPVSVRNHKVALKFEKKVQSLWLIQLTMHQDHDTLVKMIEMQSANVKQTYPPEWSPKSIYGIVDISDQRLLSRDALPCHSDLTNVSKQSSVLSSFFANGSMFTRSLARLS